MPNKKPTSPTVEIAENTRVNEGFQARGRRWSTNDLHRAVEYQKLVPFAVPLASIDLSGLAWNLTHTDDFIWHVKRMYEGDGKYPIIYDVYGCLCDGYHRVCKAILDGKTEIMAVRLTEMPRYEVMDE